MTIQAINIRNRFRGKVRSIKGDVVSEADVETAAGTEVVTFVKATEVSIARL